MPGRGAWGVGAGLRSWSPPATPEPLHRGSVSRATALLSHLGLLLAHLTKALVWLRPLPC